MRARVRAPSRMAQTSSPGLGPNRGEEVPQAVVAAQHQAVAAMQKQSNVLIAMNLPDFLAEAQVKELLEPFGTIKTFELQKDETGKSKGLNDTCSGVENARAKDEKEDAATWVGAQQEP